nr:PREDICTED: splicing factor, arginine/serine-rich 15-like [Bemisia tabaci]
MIRDLVLFTLLVHAHGYVYPKNSHHNQHQHQHHHRPARQGPPPHPAMAKYYQVPKGPGAPKYPHPPPPHWQNRGAPPNHGRPGGSPVGPARPGYYGPPKNVVPRSPQPYLHKPPNFIPLGSHYKSPVPSHRPKEPVYAPTYHAHPPPPPQPHSRYHDDERGPIRTIPAPNLNPADKNSQHYDYPSSVPEVSPHIHAQTAHLESFNGYQVTEDPSLHKPHSGQDSYFAPDPDPHVPTLKVPPTTDPHSLPSNGKLPLDIALQQEVDQSNRLTAQELFNLMNGFHPGTGGVSVVPQYVPAQAFPQIYPAPAIIMPVVAQNLDLQNLEPQAMPSNFSPQMETFNYDERTQQGAHGTDSFPEASSIDMHREMEKQASQRANFFAKPEEKAEKSRFYNANNDNSGENDEGVASNQVDFEPAERAAAKKAQKLLSSKHGADTLATLAQVQSLSSEEDSHEERKTTPDSSPILDIVRGEVVEDESEKPPREIVEETRPVFNPSHYQNAYNSQYSEADLQKNTSREEASKTRVVEMAYSSKITGAKDYAQNHKEEADSSSSEEDSKESRDGGSSMEIMEATDSGDGIKVISLETSYSSSEPKPLNSHSQLPYGARLRVKDS